MKIQIPHLNYTITLKDAFHKDMGNRPSCQRISHGESILWLPKKHRKEISTVSHEVIHVLQNICESRQINFIQETEHVAYLMMYIMAKIFDLTLVNID